MTGSLRLVVTQKGEVSLWTFVSKMTVFSALKASNLIQSLETMGPAVTHGVHSVIALRVGHECFA